MKKRMDLHAAENRVIYLGRRGENLANTIEIDASPMRKEFPECTFLLMVQRPGESSAYSAAIAMDGDVVSWPLTDADTGIAGDGCAEMRAMVGDTIAKTALFRTHIDESMNLPQEETPPAPQKGWLDQALAAQVKAEEAAQSAKHSADTAEATVNAVIDKATAATSSATQAATNANSAAQTAQTIADTVQAKLDNGDFVGAKGDKGDPGDVQDVQVAGVSVLKGGVANVPVATTDAPGVVSVLPPSDSGIKNDNGSLKVSHATDAEISGRTGTRKAIVCANMDYAVKAAMCDGKGAAWTAAEQKAARERVGIPGEFELIEELTLSENVTNVSREALLDGTPYDLRSLIIVVDSTNVENRQSVYGWVRLNAKLPQSEWIYISTGEFIGKDFPLSFFVYRVLGDGSIDSYFANVASTSATGYISDRCYIPRNVIRFGTHIRDFLLYSTDAAIPAGTKISIYGVQT